MPAAMLRMRDVCARTGLTRSTIHHYIREGLLPKPVKTARNTALYDDDFVQRARLVRALQEKTHLPLAAIRETLAGVPDATLGAVDPDRFSSVAHAVTQELRLGSERALTRAELREATGLTDGELDALVAARLIAPHRDGGVERFSPLDGRIAGAIARLRRAGSTLDGIFAGSADIVRAYRRHLTEVARVEARELVRLIRPLASIDVGPFVHDMIEPLGDLVAALHRKALVQAVSELTDGGNDGDPRR